MSEPQGQGNLDPSALPASSSPDLVVVPATPLECEHTWFLNAIEWQGPLSMTQYYQRERHLLKVDLTRDNGSTTWILTSTKLPVHSDGTRPILASCETLRKSAYVARNGDVEAILAHGIASVFTRPQYRGKGYAGRMMSELAKQLASYQQQLGNPGHFSVLFSDIGPKFYARYGWKVFASTHIHLVSLDAEQYESAKASLPPVEDLVKDDLKLLPTEAYMEEFLTMISRDNSNVPCVAIRPDLAHFDWHQAREEVSGLMQGFPFPTIKGAIHKATGLALVWARVHSSKPQNCSLHVLHVVIPPALRAQPTEEASNALAALLLRAQYEAFASKMPFGVEVWDPTEFVIAAAQRLRTVEQGKVEVIRRDEEHLCSLRWIGHRVGDDINKDVLWVNAEKYTWC